MAMEVHKSSKLTVVVSLALILVLNGSSLSNTSFQVAFASTEDNCYDEGGNYICENFDDGNVSNDNSSEDDSGYDDPSSNTYCNDEEGAYICPAEVPTSPTNDGEDSAPPPADDVLPDNPGEVVEPPPDNPPGEVVEPPPTNNVPPADNVSPIADAGPDRAISEGGIITLDGTKSTDPDGFELTYDWKPGDEELDSPTLISLDNQDKQEAKFKGPQVDSDIDYFITLTVTDVGGNTDSDDVVLTVKDTTPEIPLIIDPCLDNATAIDCKPPVQGPPIIDPCLDNATAIDCKPPVQGPSADPCLTNETGCPPIELPPPTDPCLANETGCPPIDMPPMCQNNTSADTGCETPNNPPVANAGDDQIVEEGSEVTLDGSGSYDSDGNITHSWIQTNDEPSVTLADANTPSSSFSAPLVNNDSKVTLQLVVTDNDADTDADDINIVIKNTDTTIVPPPEGSIILDEIPSQIDAGAVFVFSGILNITGMNDYRSAYIQIKDFNNGSDDILSFNTADPNGRYVSEWTARPRETSYEVYAVYEDGFGHALKSNVQSFSVNESQIIYQNESQEMMGLSGPYIPINFNDHKKSTLNVYVTATDSSSVSFIPIAVKALEHWSEVLQHKSKNHDAWKFNIFTSRNFPSPNNNEHPINVLVSLEQKAKCDGWGGFAHTFFLERLFRGHIKITVFTGCGSRLWPEGEVFRITSHEFGHALGLGHTWNEGNPADRTADMMCSREALSIFDGLAGKFSETCDTPNDIYVDKGQPSEFNIRAVLYAYGNDGFQDPNLRLKSNEIYVCQPLPCVPAGNMHGPKKNEPPIPPSQPIRKPIEEPPKDDKKKKTSTTTSVTKIIKQIIEYHYVGKIGFPGTGKGQVLEPTDLVFDAQSNLIYVSDKDNNRIDVFESAGSYIRSWGTEGPNKGQFKKPADLAADFPANLIFISDLGNNRIQKFDTNGTFLGMWGSTGRSLGQFDHVGDLELDTNEKIVYVTDIGNHRVQKFDYDGKFISTWGAFGASAGQFDRPAGLAYDSSGIVFVADTNNNRIQKFDKNGSYIGKWGTYGTGRGQLDNPVSVTVDPLSGNLYVTHGGNKKIQVFDKDGKFVDSWGTTGIGNGQFKRAVSIIFGNEEKVYVVDKEKSEIQIFKIGYESEAIRQQKKTTSIIKSDDRKKSDNDRPNTGVTKDYNANIELNFESDCWRETLVKLNDGEFGKNLARKTIKIDPNSDEPNDLWQYMTLRFDGNKVQKGKLQVLLEISGFQDQFLESIYDSQSFSKSKKTYNFEFNNLVECQPMTN